MKLILKRGANLTNNLQTATSEIYRKNLGIS